jgi:hypothetical protein
VRHSPAPQSLRPRRRRFTRASRRTDSRGLAGCSPNSRIGFGSAFVEVSFGIGSGKEIPEISRDGATAQRQYCRLVRCGLMPVFAQLVFSGEVLPDSGRFGSRLSTTVPLVESVPEGPEVSIVSA